MLHMAAEMLVARGISKYGEEVVFVAGVPPGIASSTNVVKLHRIGEEAKLH
jgi:pyruvate kinase